MERPRRAAERKRRDQVRCPRCAAWGAPVYSQRAKRGMIVRYRRCSACGHTFKTVQGAEKI